MGRFVSEDAELIEKMKSEIINEKVKVFINEMCELGCNKNDIIELIKELG